MKKILSITVLAIAGFSYWQLHTESKTNGVQSLAIERSSNITASKVVEEESFTEQWDMLASSQSDPQQSTASSQQEKVSSDDVNGIQPDNSDPEEVLSAFVATGKPEQIMQYYAEMRRARAELVKDKMDTESVDSRWSEDLAQQFDNLEKLVPTLSGTNLNEADCRQTICALQVGFDTDQSYQSFLPYMEHIGTLFGSDVFVHHDAEPGAAVIYIAKPNIPLPNLKEENQG